MTVDYSKHSLQASNSDSTVKVFFPDAEITSTLSVEKNKTANEECEPSHTNWAIKIVFICLAFAAIGINDSATGSNLHNIQDKYSINFNQTSFLFLSNAGGYAISSLCTCHIMFLLGVRITIFLSAIIYTAGALMMALAPPFPVVVVSLFRGWCALNVNCLSYQSHSAGHRQWISRRSSYICSYAHSIFGCILARLLDILFWIGVSEQWKSKPGD